MDWGERIDRLTAGYRDAALIIFGVKTGLFEEVGRARRTAAEVAGARGLDVRAVGVVMNALCATGLLEREGDRYRIPEEARPYLLADGEEARVSIIGHNRTLLHRWAALDTVLRTGEPAPSRAEDHEAGEEEMRDFILGMENVSRRSSEEVAAAVDLSGCRRMLDLGGGPGTSSLVFARVNPDLECVVFDLPGPVGIAREQIAAAGLEDRVTTVAGDFLTDPLGEGFDLVYVANILHMLGPDECVDLLRKAAGALNPAGRILVKDFFLDESRTSPPFAAQFSVNMLVSTARGRSYTRGEAEAQLAAAGFAVGRSWTIAQHSLVLEAKRES